MSEYLWPAIFLKHFICDFPLQMTPWMYLNKGTYGHPGGLAHALVHGAGMMVVCLALGMGEVALLAAVMDTVAHYHIDYAKVGLGRYWGLKPDNSEWFWVLFGLDQLLHYLTYWFIFYC